jgi:hypothetical protein
MEEIEDIKRKGLRTILIFFVIQNPPHLGNLKIVLEEVFEGF